MSRLLFTILCLAILILSSCVSVDARDPNSTLPSNRPASWEGQSLGVPL